MKRAALAVGLALLLTGCHLDATIGVRVDARGGGEVRARFELDRELVAALRDTGKPVAEQPRVGDLTRAGWSTKGFHETRNGGGEFELSKRFADPAGLRATIDELSGPQGPLRAFALTRRRKGLSVRTTLRGTIDLRGAPTGISGDPQLQQRLGAAGVDTADLQQALQAASARAITVRVAAHVPGAVDDNAPQHVGGQPVWVPKLGQQIRIVATATRTNWRRPVLAGAAVVLMLLAVVALTRPWMWRHRRTP